MRSLMFARDAAQQLRVTLVERPVASVADLHTALRTLRPGEVDAIGYVADAMVTKPSKSRDRHRDRKEVADDSWRP